MFPHSRIERRGAPKPPGTKPPLHSTAGVALQWDQFPILRSGIRKMPDSLATIFSIGRSATSAPNSRKSRLESSTDPEAERTGPKQCQVRGFRLHTAQLVDQAPRLFLDSTENNLLSITGAWSVSKRRRCRADSTGLQPLVRSEPEYCPEGATGPDGHGPRSPERDSAS